MFAAFVASVVAELANAVPFVLVQTIAAVPGPVAVQSPVRPPIRFRLACT